MGLYLYCVTRPGNAPGLTFAGICGAEVRGLALAGFSVWAETAQRRPDASLETVRGHHRVVERAAEGGPVLPLRFGQLVSDAGEVDAALQRRRDEYEEALDRVEGAVEVGLRLVDPDASATPEPAAAAARAGPGGEPSGGRGRAYLEALRERERSRVRRLRRGEELARALADDLGPVLREERIGEPPGPGDLVTVAHLLAREDVERHADVVRAFQERHPELRIVTSGPWPPYSFTPGETNDDGATGREEP